MEVLDPHQVSPACELKNELARLCLPSANRDANLKLAWVNSICILFLVIGLAGARRGVISIKNVPPIQEIVPIVVMPQTLPPQVAIPQRRVQPQEQSEQSRVFVVTNRNDIVLKYNELVKQVEKNQNGGGSQ